MAAHRDRPAVALGERTVYTYGELEQRVRRLAGALRAACGDRSGERVVLVMRNTVQYVELMFAIWAAGLCAVPVNSKLHPKELDYVLRDCGARVCISHGELLEGLKGVTGGFEGLELIDAESSRYEQMAAGHLTPLRPAAEEDLAWIFYTSGTTGRPKGVMLTHANLVAMAMCFHADVVAVDHRDAIVHAAPLSHGSGLYAIPVWMKGGRQVVPPSGGFDAAELFAIVASVERVNLFASPTIVKRMVRYVEEAAPPTNNLKTVIVGGAPFYVEDVRGAVARLGPKIAQIYGQGETPMTITAQSASDIEAAIKRDDDEMLASVGARQSLVEVQVWDAGDQLCPAGTLGEVVVRGATVMKGYWNNPQASENTLAGGWLRTGDVGYLTERGLLVLKDRSKDVIISGGSNIYPREVEEILLLHPDVADAAVIGRPSAEWGEEVCAFVVVRKGRSLASQDLDRLCLDRIARFKRPKEYVFVESLPKNNTGKVLKTALREMLRANSR
ncbi:MAG TPA: AMP-binding protein [Burkholderiales bacterium]|nr:AMP-binding protein [Burkholderiales bacterium]